MRPIEKKNKGNISTAAAHTNYYENHVRCLLDLTLESYTLIPNPGHVAYHGWLLDHQQHHALCFPGRDKNLRWILKLTREKDLALHVSTTQHHYISETVTVQNNYFNHGAKLPHLMTVKAKGEYEQMEERLLTSILNFYSRNIYIKNLHLKI